MANSNKKFMKTVRQLVEKALEEHTFLFSSPKQIALPLDWDGLSGKVRAKPSRPLRTAAASRRPTRKSAKSSVSPYPTAATRCSTSCRCLCRRSTC